MFSKFCAVVKTENFETAVCITSLWYVSLVVCYVKSHLLMSGPH